MDLTRQICKKKNARILTLGDFSASFDDAVAGVVNFLLGPLVGEEVKAQARKRAQEADVNRWPEEKKAENGDHVHRGSKEEEGVALWWKGHPKELDPEWTQISQLRE